MSELLLYATVRCMLVALVALVVSTVAADSSVVTHPL
jgi:hypothetical protein